jgi:hypothetical protein
MIEFACSCGKRYVVKDEMAGKTGTCKQCGEPIRVPAKAAGEKTAQQGKPDGPMPWDEGPARKLAKLEKKCGDAPVYLLLAARRFFTGPGTVEFRSNVLCVRGTLGVDPVELSAFWLVTVIIGNFAIAIVPIRVVLDYGAFVFNIACVAYLIFRLLTGREMKTLFVRPEKTDSVVCKGPIVTIKTKAALAPGLMAIRIFVSPRLRERFFRQFNKLFPKSLPDNYQAAVRQIEPAGSKEDEYY